ncbi:hypothetical protein F5B19DRAFT_500527 [Rostrohypoxylon terebratum]|nr:hypothetical protein F5B19DRAFT_500527 [Rostrohypoxylon terebratum]
MPVPVHYYNLPKGRDFLFTSTCPGVLNSVHNAGSAKGVAFVNDTDHEMIIPERTKVGLIGEVTNEVFQTAPWETADIIRAVALQADDYDETPDDDDCGHIAAEFTISEDMDVVMQSSDVTPEQVWELLQDKQKTVNHSQSFNHQDS